VTYGKSDSANVFASQFMKMRNRTASGSPGPNRKENVATAPPEVVDGSDAGSGFATGVGYEGRTPW
jgi:hypothetical protein